MRAQGGRDLDVEPQARAHQQVPGRLETDATPADVEGLRGVGEGDAAGVLAADVQGEPEVDAILPPSVARHFSCEVGGS